MTTNRSVGGQFSQAPSVLDPFLYELLLAIRELSDGFSTQAHSRPMATKLSCDPAFVEALITSARRRSLIEPFPLPGRKGAIRWRISRRGEQFLTFHIAASK